MKNRLPPSSSFYWTIRAAIFAVVLTILLEIVESDPQLAISITAGLIGLIIGLLLDILTKQSRLEDLSILFSRLHEYPDLQVKIEQLVGRLFDIREWNDAEYTKKGDDLLHELIGELAMLSEGRMRINSSEEMSFLIDALQRCKQDLRVCSWRDTVKYWEGREGNKYLRETKKIVGEKKVKVSRIFLLQEDQLNEYKTVMESQRDEYGIDVRVALLNDDFPSECIESYVIYDNTALRTEEWVKEDKKNAILSINEHDIDRYQRQFREIQLLSTGLDEFVFPQDDELGE